MHIKPACARGVQSRIVWDRSACVTSCTLEEIHDNELLSD